MAAPIRHTTAIRYRYKALTCDVAAWRTWRIPQKGTEDMRIRLQGTEDECRRTADAIATVLDVLETSHPYPNRPPSRLVRLHLTVQPPAPQKEA